ARQQEQPVEQEVVQPRAVAHDVDDGALLVERAQALGIARLEVELAEEAPREEGRRAPEGGRHRRVRIPPSGHERRGLLLLRVRTGHETQRNVGHARKVHNQRVLGVGSWLRAQIEEIAADAALRRYGIALLATHVMTAVWFLSGSYSDMARAG